MASHIWLSDHSLLALASGKWVSNFCMFPLVKKNPESWALTYFHEPVCSWLVLPAIVIHPNIWVPLFWTHHFPERAFSDVLWHPCCWFGWVLLLHSQSSCASLRRAFITPFNCFFHQPSPSVDHKLHPHRDCLSYLLLYPYLAQSPTENTLDKQFLNELIGLIISQRQAGWYTSWYLLGEFGLLERRKGVKMGRNSATSVSARVLLAPQMNFLN